jgi:hypothetical protein
MARRNLTFRVFVSSTFSDLKAERNALQERAFPGLRAYCQEKGARFQVIDLRWAVTEEETKHGKVLEVCLDEIERCHPFHIGIVKETEGTMLHENERLACDSTVSHD